MGARRLNKQANFFGLPDVPTGYSQMPNWSVVVPLLYDETNMVNNPSFEIGDTNYEHTASGSEILIRSTDQQYFGAYSLTLSIDTSPGAGGRQGIIYGVITPLSFTSGIDYVISAYFYSAVGGRRFLIGVTPTGSNTLLAQKQFFSTGFWQRIWLVYRETSTNNRRITITNDSVQGIADGASTAFFIDGVQVCATPSGENPVLTTYIDGDQTGLTPNEFPPPYYWSGTPHLSQSVRSAFTRHGGKIVNFRELGLDHVASTGLGLVVPDHTSLPYGQLDGETFQRTQKNSRIFSLAGRVTGRSIIHLDSLFSSLSNEMDTDSSPRREPLLLKYQPMDEEENPTGPELDVVATYNGGLESSRDNLNTELFTLNFKQYDPALLSHTEGSLLTVNTTITNSDGILRRDQDGSWSRL